jgi:hypothetical protein
MARRIANTITLSSEQLNAITRRLETLACQLRETAAEIGEEGVFEMADEGFASIVMYSCDDISRAINKGRVVKNESEQPFALHEGALSKPRRVRRGKR